MLQNAGFWPQSASAEQALPMREWPHVPAATSQLAEPQSASWKHLGRHNPPRQRCSLRQPAPEAHDLRHSFEDALMVTQVASAGHAPEAVQSREQ